MSEPLEVPTREGYDLWSQIYDDEDNPLIALETAWVTRLLGDVRGMAAAGAHVVGVDFSPGMLAKLRAKPGAGAVRLVQHDLTIGLPFASGSMDRVTCCLVLEHVADLASAFAEMSRICRAGGFVLVSDLHPAMRLLGTQAQFTDPATGRKTRPAGARHQLSDYVIAATRAELHIDHMSEHVADEELAARSPRSQKYLGWPLLLVMRLRRA
jgi:SAM-dependent methyltransferase